MRDVEHLLAERGITVSYETIRRWVTHFGPMIAADLGKRRPKPHTIWHLDEVYLKIDGRLVYLWRAVDAEGEVLDVLVQTRRSRAAALKLMRKLLKKFCFVPEAVVTDDLRSFGAMTAKSVEKPFFSLTSALAKASSAALPRGPMILRPRPKERSRQSPNPTMIRPRSGTELAMPLTCMPFKKRTRPLGRARVTR